MVGRGDGVAAQVDQLECFVQYGMCLRCEKGNNLCGGEASGISEASEDGVNGIGGLRDGQVGGGLGSVHAACTIV